MKKTYSSPEMEIERFLFEDVLTSSGINVGNGDVDKNMDENDEGFVHS